MTANIYSAVYSGVPVYEMMCRGIAVMRRRADSYLNATQILKVAGIEKGKRTKILEREVLIGEHEKVQGGYGKYQGTWIPFEKGKELAERYQVEPYLRPLMEYDPHAAARSGGVDRTPTKEQAMAAQRKQQQQHPPGTTTSSPLNSTMHGAMSMMASTAASTSPMTSSSPLRGYNQSQEPPRKKMKASSPFSSSVNGYAYSPPDNSMAHIGEASNATEGSGERHRAVLMAIFLNEDPNHIPDLLTNPNSPADLDIELVIDDQGHTALHWAAALARINILQLLVNKGANVRKTNFTGETALMRAVLVTNNYDNESFPQLLEIIADSIQICDRKNRTVFHHIALTAGIKGRAPASRYYMECLLEFIARHRGGDFASIVDVQDNNGDTALNIAARVGNKSIVDQLLDVGANRYIENKVGLKPEDFGIEDVKVNR
ncbi:hypothetical protein BC936DRAFT_149740 [Jimgerdemannia flammicorona]|uniref:HTH APSES-type domain-containing protein n=1 Tax=Jimgerdemannia flammicorona TaxID=994334 RepID=A0A433D072_9FUNG|nr:hypothetical protein BC936DRAFT_149740 [Jimgerdemannia flammicorona]